MSIFKPISRIKHDKHKHKIGRKKLIGPRCQYKNCQKLAVGVSDIRYCAKHGAMWSRWNPGKTLDKIMER